MSPDVRMMSPLREKSPVDKTVEHDGGEDDPFCHRLRPGTDFNYCGKPYRSGRRMHTALECVLSGHVRCPTCVALGTIGHSNN